MSPSLVQDWWYRLMAGADWDAASSESAGHSVRTYLPHPLVVYFARSRWSPGPARRAGAIGAWSHSGTHVARGMRGRRRRALVGNWIISLARRHNDAACMCLGLGGIW